MKFVFLLLIFVSIACGEDQVDGERWDLGDNLTDMGSTAPCVPYDDQCPQGQYCQYADGELSCVDEGEIEPVANTIPECPSGTCSKGGMCMPSDNLFATVPGNNLWCFHVCDPTDEEDWNGGCVNTRHTCYAAQDGDAVLSFGICDYTSPY